MLLYKYLRRFILTGIFVLRQKNPPIIERIFLYLNPLKNLDKIYFMNSTFAEKIYQQLKKVPKGRVTTYKELANSLNSKAYQAVGTTMKNNPYAPYVPCHRVVNSDGSIGGFKGKKTGKTIKEKIKMLKNEGIEIKNGKIVDFKNIIYKFK